MSENRVVQGADDGDCHLMVTLIAAGRAIDGERRHQHGRQHCRNRDDTSAFDALPIGFAPDRSDESIPLPRHRLDEPGRSGIVVQRLAELADAVIESAIEIDMDAVAPDRRLELLAPHQRPRPPDQARQHQRRLALQRNRNAPASKLAGGEVDVVRAERAPRSTVHEGLDGAPAAGFEV